MVITFIEEGLLIALAASGVTILGMWVDYRFRRTKDMDHGAAD